jgi:hypothetical protein
MHPMVLFEPSMALKVVVAAISIVALGFYIRNYLRNGRL